MDQFDIDIYRKSAHYYRGLLINEFCGLEKSLEFVLSSYFIKRDKTAIELMTIFLDRMTFEAKRTSLKYILDKVDVAGGFKKSKNNSYPSSSFIEELRLLNNERNYFAHYSLVIPEDGNYDKLIGLAEFRDYAKIFWYTEDKYSKTIERIHNATAKINSYYEKI
jgi:hypothetical protein